MSAGTNNSPPVDVPESNRFDLVVIGSGPAGEKGAAAAAYFKKRVAVIEKEDHHGGAAANTGTLPSKTLRETALILSGLRQRKIFGLEFGLAGGVKIQDFLQHERRVKDLERFRIHENLTRRHNVSIFRGKAAFLDEHTLAVTPARCKAEYIWGEKVLIATGSYPYRPAELFPFTNPHVYDSDTVLSLYEIPETLLVVGGGVIGCEYACMFAALNARVTLVEKRDRLLGGMEGEIARSLHDQMVDAGMRIIFEEEVASVRARPDGLMDVPLARGGEVLRVHAILVSSGRSGQTAELGLEKVGIKVNKRGHVLVDPRTFQTSVPHIYAAGDVIGNPALASTAMAQARMAVAHAFELPFNTGLAEILPAGIYTIPECSMAGRTEEELQEAGVDYVVGRASYASNARGQIIGDSKGFLKLIFREPDLELLGVHVIGEQATELVHIGLTALQLKEKAELFIHTCYNYPTLSELYKYAAYDALGKHQKQLAERGAEVVRAGPAQTTGRPA